MRESFMGMDSISISDAKHPSEVGEPNHPSVSSEHAVQTATLQKPYRRKRVLEWLQDQVPEKRLQHILRVEAMATQLAQHHGLDTEKAAQSGLMHDLAKNFKAKQLLKMAEMEGLAIDDVFMANPHLLHADVGAIVARDEFGIYDPEVLAAIRNHTLGSPEMSPLSCVVYLADGLEPGRGSTSELEHLRQTSLENLHQAVWLTSDYTLKHLLTNSNLVHPRAVLTRNWAMQEALHQQKTKKKSSKTI